MSWVVDTCVVIDIFRGDHDFADVSADALDLLSADGLTIAPVTYVELAPEFRGDVASQDAFLEAVGIKVDFRGNRDAVLSAHKAWHEHILRKRAGAAIKRPIADVLIGAYALSKGGLITRNEADFRSLYPGLRIFNPGQPRG